MTTSVDVEGSDSATEPAPAIGILSDVHGNLHALEAVLASLDREKVTRIWCLGDTVGYGAFPAECVAAMQSRAEIVLAGNHEVVLREPGNLFGGSAGAGIAHARAVLDEAQIAWLATKPSHEIFREVELYHAAAMDPVWEYVRDQTAARDHLDIQRAPLSLVGHSHLQLAFYRQLPDSPRAPVSGGPVAAGTELSLHERRVVANPGSVGQPRDGDPRAGYAVLRPGRLSFYRVEYDVEAAANAYAAAGLPSEAGQLLYRGG